MVQPKQAHNYVVVADVIRENIRITHYHVIYSVCFPEGRATLLYHRTDRLANTPGILPARQESPALLPQFSSSATL